VGFGFHWLHIAFVLGLIIHPEHVLIFAVNERAAAIDVMGLNMHAVGV
jgi:hypothetical protein